jgi:hypothetical protein
MGIAEPEVLGIGSPGMVAISNTRRTGTSKYAAFPFPNNQRVKILEIPPMAIRSRTNLMGERPRLGLGNYMSR